MIDGEPAGVVLRMGLLLPHDARHEVALAKQLVAEEPQGRRLAIVDGDEYRSSAGHQVAGEAEPALHEGEPLRMREGVARTGGGIRVRKRLVACIVRRIDVDQVESALVRPLKKHKGSEVVPLDQVVGARFPVVADAQRLDLSKAEVGPRQE